MDRKTNLLIESSLNVTSQKADRLVPKGKGLVAGGSQADQIAPTTNPVKRENPKTSLKRKLGTK
jgi:hypothetical protein